MKEGINLSPSSDTRGGIKHLMASSVGNTIPPVAKYLAAPERHTLSAFDAWKNA